MNGLRVKSVRYLGRKNNKKERPFLEVGKVYEVFGELLDIEKIGEIRFFRIHHNMEYNGTKGVIATYIYRRSEFEVFEYGVPEIPEIFKENNKYENISSHKEDKNILNHLNDYYLEPNQSINEKFNKVKEEFYEVKDCFENNYNNSDTAQEMLDLILTSVNLLKKMEREDLITISEEVEIHKDKLEYYLKSGKYSK
ncbi:MAG: hypothetical protein ACRCZO_19060 [Cetobacterium sp.]